MISITSLTSPTGIDLHRLAGITIARSTEPTSEARIASRTTIMTWRAFSCAKCKGLWGIPSGGLPTALRGMPLIGRPVGVLAEVMVTEVGHYSGRLAAV